MPGQQEGCSGSGEVSAQLLQGASAVSEVQEGRLRDDGRVEARLLVQPIWTSHRRRGPQRPEEGRHEDLSSELIIDTANTQINKFRAYMCIYLHALLQIFYLS